LKHGSRFRDSILYVTVGLFVVAAVLLYAEYAPDKDLPVREIWFVLFTALVFGYVAKEFRSVWFVTRFWAVYVTMLAAHLVAFWALLSYLEAHFLLTTSILAGVEVILLCVVVEKLVGDRQHRKHSG
jgi:peptidoglycan/LPS O-acetylase OafA/YrhL